VDEKQFNALLKELRILGNAIQSVQPVSLSITSYLACAECIKEHNENPASDQVRGYMLPIIGNGQLVWKCSSCGNIVR
jgi:hypothetical protein